MKNKRVVEIKAFFIDYLILGIFLFYIFFMWKAYPFSLGGSLFFMSLVGYGYYLSLVYKEISMELSILSLVLFSLMGLNFIGYLEHTNGFSVGVAIGVIVFQIIIFGGIWFLIQNPFGKETSQSSVDRLELKKRIFSFILSKIGNALLFIGITAIPLIILKNEPIVKKHIYSFSELSLLWLMIGQILVLNYRKEALDKAIPCLIMKRSEIDITFIKRNFVLIVLCVCLVGSALEIMRGLWILWIFSWLSIILIIMTLWKIWRAVFINENLSDNTHIKEDIIKAIPSFSSSKYFFKYIGIFTISGVIYFFLLFSIWYFWGR